MSTPNSAPDSAAVGGWLSLRGLAKAIGVDAGQLSKESSRPGFPGHRTDAGTVYDPAEVLRWRQQHVRQKKPPPEPEAVPATPAKVHRASPPTAMPPGPASPPVMDPKATLASAAMEEIDVALLDVLNSPTSSALEISRAAMQLASRRVARAHRDKALGHNDFDGLKKALQELRTAEAGYIELEKQRGGLIARDDVRAIVAECCGRLVRVLGILENSIAMEFSIWLSDPKVTQMGADERTRLIRAYVAKITREARTTEADEIDLLIRQPRTE